MKRPPPAPPPTPTPNDSGAKVIFGIIAMLVIVVSVAQCSSRPSSSTAPPTNTAASAQQPNRIAAQPRQPPQALSVQSVNRGFAHFRLARTPEGFTGAMIYSQNCYDALNRQFSWQKLDVCGAFDMLAARAIEDAETADIAAEIAYFQSETAAGRYLAAAVSAGEPPPEADERLTQLQTRTSRASLPARTVPSEPPSSNTIDAQQNAAVMPGPMDPEDEAPFERE